MTQLPQHQRQAALRIIDANFDRAGEGLRVIEEYARFVLDNRILSEQAKILRHELRDALLRIELSDLLSARNTAGDVGCTISTPTESVRTDLAEVVRASFQRVQQALRSIEEYGKLIDIELARAIEGLRYRSYQLESLLLRAAPVREQLKNSRLYVLVDGGASDDQFLETVERLVAAKVEVVQLRDKSNKSARLDDRTLLARARLLRTATQGTDTLFIVNDRPDLAALAHADGVHVGQDELPVSDVRKIVGADMLIGVSTHCIEQARQAVLDGADYLGCGPTFPSSTKSFTHFPGLEFLRQVAAEISLPTFAIGGITPENVGEVLATGIGRIAVSASATTASELKRLLIPLS